MKRIAMMVLLGLLAASLAACGGGGGGGGGVTSGLTDFNALAADQRGYTDGVLAVQNSAPVDPVKKSAASFIAAQKSGSATQALRAPSRSAAPLLRMKEREPQRFTGSASGTVGGYFYSLSASILFYNVQEQQVMFETVNEYTPEATVRSMITSVRRMTASLSGTIGPLQLSWTANANPMTLSLSQDASTLTMNAASVTEQGSLREGALAYSYSASYSENAVVGTENGNVISDTSTGSFTMTLPEGWSLAGQFSGANYSGYVLQNGIPQASFSGNDNAITVTDFESHQVATIQ